MDLRLPIAAITDEFSPDLETACAAMASVGMRGAELRVLWGKNIMDLTDEELVRAKSILDAHGLEAIGIASPLLKCTLPDSPPLDERFEHDVFASAHTYEDQPRLMRRAAEIAHRMGARLIRVFSFWRTVEPEKCLGRLTQLLGEFAEQAAKEDLVLGLENEHACHVGTAAEAARVLAAVNHPNLSLVWDPANAFVAGEEPFPEGFDQLPFGKVAHVHAKDCWMKGGKPHWVPLATGAVDWKGQLIALVERGYGGWVSLETHWSGPNGDKLQASVICGWNLRGLLSW
ncbi:MAG: sugar phosphate isomerase/epimerase family protein [Bryobacteraceae bacterium]